ncbi:hypothetical protein HO173_000102 [Letharia columbiana]|uniref:Peptidase M48 domain-containing protein n=1 Tax=Letharia columbiana TaxID=112416 RepID=A0A8H6LAB6_9LECA|nr:uncharacterized protein HO173_000102 [Letharia columbiana]KAF6241392.1 hypothetical protein HO173_000102 [Letharia columbiana]
MEEMERVDMEKFKENEKKLVVNSDYPGLRKIEAVLDRLVKASGLDDIAWEVRILDEPNAEISCVTRSGLVLISTGFFYHAISNDDELAAILGHNIASVLARHVLETEFVILANKYFTISFLPLALLASICIEGIVFLVPFSVSWLASLALSRVRHREADYIGLLLMTDAGFDPSGAVSFWKKVNEWQEQQRRATKRIRQDPQFRSSHPHVCFKKQTDGEMDTGDPLHLGGPAVRYGLGS